MRWCAYVVAGLGWVFSIRKLSRNRLLLSKNLISFCVKFRFEIGLLYEAWCDEIFFTLVVNSNNEFLVLLDLVLFSIQQWLK